jgi:glutaminyl-peptide cyclotransferase
MTGHSCLQIVHPDTGKIIKRVSIDKTLFGEGITVVKDKVYMLTWKNKKMLIFDAQTLEVQHSCRTGEKS